MADQWCWLDSTYRLQRDVFNVHHPFASDKERVESILINAFAASKELSELTDEVGWKPWASKRDWINRANVLNEAVDVAHFLANILCAIDVTDEEWEEAYQAKQAVNATRQREGYDGITGKCPGCKRAYDDGIQCLVADDPVNVSHLPWCDVKRSNV